MLAFLLAGDGTVVSDTTTRAQIPLLLAQAANLTTVSLEQATEADEAQDITVVVVTTTIVQVQQATETDVAFDFTVVVTQNQSVPIDLATETDEAFDFEVFAPVDSVIILDVATETDEAFGFTYRRSAMTPAFVGDDTFLSPAVVTEIDLTPVEVS